MTNAINELDAAKTIVESLKGLEKQQQERAIRFAAETLGLQLGRSPQSPALVIPTPQPTAGTHFTSTATGRPIDIKQFTASKAPRSDQQFATVVAYYYKFEAPPEERRDTIDAAALADAARLVVRKRPTRFALSNAKNQGYLDLVGGGEYRINTVGENLVAITLPGNASDGGNRRGKRTIKKGARKKTKKKAKS